MEACQVAIREHLPVSPGSPAATASAVCLGLQALVDDASETSLRHKFASVGNSRRLQAATLHLSEGLDVVFIFLAAVLVFFMQAGFAMVRAQVRLPKQCILTKPSLIRLSYTMRTSQLDSKLVHLHRLTNSAACACVNQRARCATHEGNHLVTTTGFAAFTACQPRELLQACSAPRVVLRLQLEVGSVRSKNAMNILVKNAMDSCMNGLAFAAFGYSVAYGTGKSANSFAGAGDVFLTASARDGDWLAFLFQWAFASTAATIVSGSVAERIRFDAYLVHSALMTIATYPVVAHWCAIHCCGLVLQIALHVSCVDCHVVIRHRRQSCQCAHRSHITLLLRVCRPSGLRCG